MSSYVEILTTFMQSGWEFLTSFEFPGLGVSLAVVMLGLFVISISIHLFHSAAGQPDASTPYRVATTSHRIRISSERKNDEL